MQKRSDDATSLDDLAALPGNRLEALRGERQGQYSMHMNERHRIRFVWHWGDAHDVESVSDQ